MAKKKKTQLKPVARGFTTTSLPKKTIPTPEVLFDKIMPDLLESSPDASAIASEDGYASADVVANKVANHNNVEEQHLQGLVDKLQEKTEKEIMRYSSDPLYDPLFPNLSVGL